MVVSALRMSILLVSLLTLLVSLAVIFLLLGDIEGVLMQIILSITCKYKSSDKKFRIAFIFTIGIATALLGWANAPVKKKLLSDIF